MMPDPVDTALEDIRECLSNRANWRESWVAPVRKSVDTIEKYVIEQRAAYAILHDDSRRMVDTCDGLREAIRKIKQITLESDNL